MNVLVTGADGFVGQHVVAALLERGHAVTGAIHADAPAAGTLGDGDAARVAWRAFDLRDAESVHALVAAASPDAVLHLGGIASVSQSFREPEATFDINATGTLRLLEALRRLPPPPSPRPVLLVSSGEVYGADGTEGAPLTEDMPLRPVTPYGASKAAAELLAAVMADPAMRLVQTRSFQQIGPGQRPAFVTANWAQQLVDIRDGAQPAELRVGNLDIERDFLDVRDAAEAYVTLLEAAGVAGVFNLCSGRACSLRRLLDLLQDAAGVRADIRVDRDRLRPAEIRSLVGSPRRLIEATGWRPRRPIEESVRDLVASLEPAHRTA